MANEKSNLKRKKGRPEVLNNFDPLNPKDVEKVYKALTVRQRRFCEEYVIDFEGKAAAIRAGYSPTWADRQAHLLIKHELVAAYIDHLTRSKEAKIVSVNPDWVIQGIVAVATKEYAKDGDKLRAYELLARHLGMFIERQELTGKDGGPLEIEQRRAEEEAQSFIDQLKAITDRKPTKLRIVGGNDEP